MKVTINILLILLTTFISNAEENCCEEDAKRLVEQFEKYEPVYIELYKENIRDDIKSESYFIDMYEDIDNFPLDSMEFFIIPTLKWNEKALNYQEGESICSYIDLDTVLFSSSVGIYWDSSLVVSANLGCFNCFERKQSDSSFIPLALGRPADFDPCDYEVSVYPKYWEKSYEEYQNLKNIGFDIIFDIDGFHGKQFFIENNQIKKAKDFPTDFNYNDIESELIDDALKDEITQEKIREFAVKCPCYKKKKWWQFWKWF